MSSPSQSIATVGGRDIKAFGAKTTISHANRIPGAPSDEDGRQMAAFVSRLNVEGEPLIVIGLVTGDQQTTLTLYPAEADAFCNALADAVLWQNEQLRQRAGQMVH